MKPMPKKTDEKCNTKCNTTFQKPRTTPKIEHKLGVRFPSPASFRNPRVTPKSTYLLHFTITKWCTRYKHNCAILQYFVVIMQHEMQHADGVACTKHHIIICAYCAYIALGKFRAADYSAALSFYYKLDKTLYIW